MGSSRVSHRIRRQRLKRSIVIVTILAIISLTWYMRDTKAGTVQINTTAPGLLNDSLSFSAEEGSINGGEVNDDADHQTKFEYRSASKVSPFTNAIRQIEKKIKGQSDRFFLFKMFDKVEPEKIMEDWSQSKSTEQCKYLLNGFYEVPNWCNDAILKEYQNEGVGKLVFTLMVERMRIYDRCFLHGNEDLNEILADKIFKGVTPQDFNSRMFPFMDFRGSKLLWPRVFDIAESDGNRNVLVPEPKVHDVESFNANFWQNWAKYSKGKGIILTMQESDSVMFYKQLKVFQSLGNKLPIQVVTTGQEVSEQFIKELSTYSRELGQKIYLVDVSPILIQQFTETHIHNFYNKWIAQIFNTFEEAIFIDVDAVPYIPMKDYFKIDSYKKTGILMYRDRSLIDENTFRRCIDLVHEVEPSKEEVTMTSKKLMFDSNWIKQNKHIEDDQLPSTEALIYRNFFEKLHLHHVDSGLIVINKKTKLNGLLMSFYANLDNRLRTCIYGDKEIVWLGELIAGEDYSIDPMEGGILGPINREDHGEVNKYSICGSQIGHVNRKGKLMWSNGGLRTCKFYNTAAADFESDEDYFTSRYKSSSNLQRIYDSPLVIDGVIIPDPHNDPWIQIKECSKYMYCAFATRGKTDKSGGIGNLIEFDKSARITFKDISQLWNRNDIPDVAIVPTKNI